VNRRQALKLLNGGADGVAEWNRRRDSGEKVPDLSLADLRGATLSRANLRHANLRQVDLFRADLRHADPRHADISAGLLSKADITCSEIARSTRR
jgi:uncharacterized protein YjbI with pentapeptide repeats